MKKYILLLAIFLIVPLFSSCAPKPNNELLPIEEANKYSINSDVVVTTEKNVYSTEDTVIKYIISNPTSEERTYGEHVYLHKLQDGKWYEVAFKEEDDVIIVFNDIAYFLPSHQEASRELNLAFYYNLPLEKGEYRIILGKWGVSATVSNTFTIE